MWPAESSKEYQDSTKTNWAPSWTRVGRGRDIALNVIGIWIIGSTIFTAAAYFGWIG